MITPELTSHEVFIEIASGAIGAAHALAAQISIREVTWRVCSGDFWVIGALPGSGKTDLLMAAAGLYPLLEGGLRLFGQDLTALAEPERISLRTRLGFVFDRGGRLFNGLTVAENLSLPICYHRNATPAQVESEVGQMLETFDLHECAHKTPGSLNRSVRQRVALARALALDPDVLLLDNPLLDVDPRQIQWWLDFLRKFSDVSAPGRSRPRTLIVAVDDLRLWVGEGRQFALIKDSRWQILGGRNEFETSAEPNLSDLLAKNPLSK